MPKFRNSAVTFFAWMGAATAILFFACVQLSAEDKPKPKPAPASAPAKAAPAPAPARTAPSARPTPNPNGPGARPNPATGGPRSAPSGVGVRPGPSNANQGAPRANVGRPATPRPVPLGVTRAPNGRVESFRSPKGTEAHFRPDGSVHTVSRNGNTITHGPAGSNRITVQRADRSVVVTNRSGHGYIQRPFSYRNHEYVNRTYNLHGVTYARYYRPYSYRGMELHGYVPLSYYSPAFYGWAYHPWGAPVYYNWGFMGTPWYGYYGGYFTPSPVYANSSLWLTDYLISSRLEEAYQDRGNAAPNEQAQALSGTGAITPEVKQAIAVEVQRQVALENVDSQAFARDPSAETSPTSSGVPRLLSDGASHVFLVSYTVDVTNFAGQNCAISRGDVLKLTTPPPPQAQSANLQVVASTGRGCPMGSLVSVGLQDLQDFQNQMRETIDVGLGKLQSNAGKDGLPSLPAVAAAPPTPSPFAEVAPPPDPNVTAELTQQLQEADKLEQEALNESKGGDNSQLTSDTAPVSQQSKEPLTISLGQTTDQVVAILGNPQQILNAGTKQIYRYKDMKITFISGLVSDVQ